MAEPMAADFQQAALGTTIAHIMVIPLTSFATKGRTDILEELDGDSSKVEIATISDVD